jgi:HEAT repeat protein
MTDPRLASAASTIPEGVDLDTVQVPTEGRASRSVARALGVLIDRLMALGPDRLGVVGGLEGVDRSSTAVQPVRAALRQASARSRDGAMFCRAADGILLLDGTPVDPKLFSREPGLGTLLDRLMTLQAGVLTIREGAAPGELLMVARLLAQPSRPRDVRALTATDRGTILEGSETRASAHAVPDEDESPDELLRTWSVILKAANVPKPADDAAGVADRFLERLATARTDVAATIAVGAVRDALEEALSRGDAAAVEGIARACMQTLQTIGADGGRLALEWALRLLLRSPVLELLASRLPVSTDRASLLPLFARAGDAASTIVLRHLLHANDAPARRAYFDTLIAIDVGLTQLFDTLRDPRWFVVRNTASLLGELSVRGADAELIPLLQHDDERIRIAVARGLIRVRTLPAMQALQALLEDAHPELRRLAAMAYGLIGVSIKGTLRPSAAPLLARFEIEPDEDVVMEILAALGRVGSADAVQRLMRLALPTVRTFAGEQEGEVHSADTRIAALEALVVARSHQVLPMLDILRTDPDPEVAEAAVLHRNRLM